MFTLKIPKTVFIRHILKFTQRKLCHNHITLATAAAAKHLAAEKQFVEVKLKHDPDKFGDDDPEPDITDPGDLQENKYFEEQALPSQKLKITKYADIIKSLILKRKIKEAIDVVEVRMIKEDQVKPNAYIYNLLLGALGRVGYTKKAFSIYNQMKERALNITGGTYTSLFNACANSPWPEDGLSRARKLQNIMLEKMYEPNDMNYNAMIKAFGRCGDLETAFNIADEMRNKKIRIRSDTINFLLQASISDKEAGFRHNLLVWRQMVQKKIRPSLYTFNLLLKSVRDCGIGDLEVMNEAIDKILSQTKKNLISADNSAKLILTNTGGTKLLLLGKCIENVDLANQNSEEWRPNLLTRVPHLGNIVSLSEITKAEDRLLLIGGMRGFLKNMEENKCVPDIKTFTQLLDCLPGNLESEKELLLAMKKAQVKPDLDFYNMLIKKRSMRFDYESARDVLPLIRKAGTKPDLITYGVLALGCKTKEEALFLTDEMKNHAYTLNTEILGAMLHQACYHRNFSYVLEIMEISLRENIKPNKKFLECLELFKKNCKRLSNDKDRKVPNSKTFMQGFRIFSLRYKSWLEEIQVDDTEDAHPWTQYRGKTETDAEKYKDKSVRFKARHSSRFKVKTSTKRWL